MQTGDTVRDGQGRSLKVGQLLGRGLWGKSFIVSDENAKEEWVLKCPLSADDFTQDGATLSAACQEILQEQGRLLDANPSAPLSRLVARFSSQDGTPVLLLQRESSSYATHLEAGCSLETALEFSIKIGEALQNLTDVVGGHGNLNIHNVLFGEDGRVVLADPVTPALLRVRTQLLQAYENETAYLPPEVRDPTGSVTPETSGDTYAAAMMLFQAAMTPTDADPHAVSLPSDGLEKSHLVDLKTQVHSRLKLEQANPRFHSRLSDRFAALLNRALSKQTSPSPPYRFARLDEFKSRLSEVYALVQPSISHVGKLLLDRPPKQDVFTTDEEIVFSCSVAASLGIDSYEEIACGLAVFDTQTNERMNQVSCSYTVDRHPSGRFRFGFRVADVAPGSYRVRVAFTIRESGNDPETTEGQFLVVASPGYVPPPKAPQTRPLALPPAPKQPSEDPAITWPGPASDSGIPETAVPTPIASRSSHIPAPPPPVAIPEPAASTEQRPGGLPIAVSGTVTPASGFKEDGPITAVMPNPVGNSVSNSQPAVMPPTAPVVDLGPDPLIPSFSQDRHQPDPALPANAAEVSEISQFSNHRPEAPSIGLPDGPHPVQPSPAKNAEYNDEPVYRGAGRWSELPLPQQGNDDLGSHTKTKEPEHWSGTHTEFTDLAPGPIGQQISRLIELISADAYVFFLGGAALVITLLGFVLVLLR